MRKFLLMPFLLVAAAACVPEGGTDDAETDGVLHPTESASDVSSAPAPEPGEPEAVSGEAELGMPLPDVTEIRPLEEVCCNQHYPAHCINFDDGPIKY